MALVTNMVCMNFLPLCCGPLACAGFVLCRMQPISVTVVPRGCAGLLWAVGVEKLGTITTMGFVRRVQNWVPFRGQGGCRV